MVAAASVGASLWLFGFSLWSHATIEGSNPKANSNVVSPHALVEPDMADSILQDIWPSDYNDPEFASSLTSCVEDCLGEDHIAPKTVGVLYPPGDFGLIFVDFVHATAMTHAPHSKAEIIWEPTSHLPSQETLLRYSHIVRFANLPLILAAGDAVLQFSSPKDISWRDIQDTVRLLLCWHCQLSNLVQQGLSFPLMTVTMEQIDEDALQQSILLDGFIPDLEPNDDDDAGMDPNFEDPLLDKLHEIADRIRPLLQRLDAEFRKDPSKSTQDKSLEGLVRRIVGEFLVNDVACPRNVPPMFVPSGEAARAVYESVKALSSGTSDPHKYDEELRCTEDSRADSRFCQTLPKGFDTKGLVKFLFEKQKLRLASNQEGVSLPVKK